MFGIQLLVDTYLKDIAYTDKMCVNNALTRGWNINACVNAIKTRSSVTTESTARPTLVPIESSYATSY